MDQIPASPGQIRIMTTIKDELFPSMEQLKEILIDTQKVGITFHLYSGRLNALSKRYSEASSQFFSVVKKLQTPDLLFEGIAQGADKAVVGKVMVDYMQFQGAFQKNISEGLGYVEIIDRTLDRKKQDVQNNRTLLFSLAAIVISIWFREI